jgi:integrase
MGRAGRRKSWRKHAGVTLLRREGPAGVRWLARYVDPDTKATKHETVPPEHCKTEESRTKWAGQKAKEIGKRDDALDEGAPPLTGGSLESFVARYFVDVSAGLRPKTLACYRESSDALLAWATERGIKLADELTKERLADLRTWVSNRRMRAPEKGGKRFGRTEKGRVRSPASVHRALREIRTVLQHLRKLGQVPMLTGDAIREYLRSPKMPDPTPEYLRSGALVKIIEAADRHDRTCWDLTRDEHARGLKVGATPKYAPVLSYLAFTLLTGMRADEARLLRWARVELAEGPAGIITLKPEDVKTKRGRVVDLIVSPMLQKLLAKMRLNTPPSAVFVFGDDVDEKGNVVPALTRYAVEAARKRLAKSPSEVVDEDGNVTLDDDGFGSPKFSWQQLRVSAATYLVCSPGIFGSTSAFREAKQLGHSVAVAERLYASVVVHVPPEAKTLEAAMQVEDVLRKVLKLEASAPASAARSG